MDTINIFLIVVGVTNFFLALIVYFNTSKINKVNIFFSLLTINIAFWSMAMAFFRGINNPKYIETTLKILYVTPIFIPVLFLYFVKVYTKKVSKIFQAKYYISWSFVLSLLVLNTNNFVYNTVAQQIGEKTFSFGNLYIIYVLHFVFFFGVAFYVLGKQYLSEKDALLKKQVGFLVAGTFLSSTIGMITNLLLPWFGFFNLNWLGNIMTIFLVGFILYAILKYQLFNSKIVAAEIFVIFILITLITDLFFVNSAEELTIKRFILMSVVVMSFLIIRSIYKEIENRERIQSLADNLETANIQLKKLSDQKSEFVSLASHQLRAPIASLKGYASMILEGSYGKISKDVEEPMKRIFQSSQSLALIIDDFLNLSRIERGKIEYCFSESSLIRILESALQEIKQSADSKKLKLKLITADKKDEYESNIDSEKIKQVVTNILDNAIKYTPKGSITIEIKRIKKYILIKISDTGIGIPKGADIKLFKKFKRLDNANDGSIKGTGLGLYLAKQIIDAHHGKIWAESKGKNKGTAFFVELKGCVKE